MFPAPGYLLRSPLATSRWNPRTDHTFAKRGLREVSMIARVFALAAGVVMAGGSAALALDQSARDPGRRGPVNWCFVDLARPPPLETSIAPDRLALLELNQTAPATRAKPG